jgi:hypothetical protein
LLAVIVIVRRDPLRALVAVAAWASIFEVAYHIVGIAGVGWPSENFMWMTAALAGWVILAGVLGVWPDWRLGIVSVALLGVWLAAGFHANLAGHSAPINLADEVLNELSKTTLAGAYLVGALRPSRSSAQDRHSTQVVG